jgi:hypothetical protein
MKQPTLSLQTKQQQTVWVHNVEDILETLDENGKLEGIPFMPEMISYCGRSFQISCIPNRTCVEGHNLKRVTDVVFLEDLRCDGSHHDGCQRECILFWRKEWLSLEPIEDQKQKKKEIIENGISKLISRKLDRYVCQSTELHLATSNLVGGKLTALASDLFQGKIKVPNFLFIIIRALATRVRILVRKDFLSGLKNNGMRTESLNLGLLPGELIQVKSSSEIQETLNSKGKNRGLRFEPTMLRFCGNQYKVKNRLEKIIVEETGKMVHLKNTVILEGGICKAPMCKRANLIFWREIWLKRLG